MKYIALLVSLALAISTASAASLPHATEGRENTIVLEVTPRGEDDHRESKAGDQEGEPFEIIVPVARNFSSLAELFQILREDSKEPRVAGGTPPTYVKGTEKNSSDFLIFLTDDV